MNLDGQVTIDARPEAVWRHLTNFESVGTVIPLVKSAQLLDPELAPGARVRLVMEYAQVSVAIDAVVEVVDPPREFGLRADAAEPAGQLVAGWRLVPAGEATRLEQRAKVTFSSPMVRLAAKALMAQALGAGGVDAALQKLKAAVEAVDDG